MLSSFYIQDESIKTFYSRKSFGILSGGIRIIQVSWELTTIGILWKHSASLPKHLISPWKFFLTFGHFPMLVLSNVKRKVNLYSGHFFSVILFYFLFFPLSSAKLFSLTILLVIAKEKAHEFIFLFHVIGSFLL